MEEKSNEDEIPEHPGFVADSNIRRVLSRSEISECSGEKRVRMAFCGTNRLSF
jgi:hypothetical protein